MKRRLRALGCLLLVATALLAAGCGSGSKTTPARLATSATSTQPSTPVGSSARFIARADHICAQVNEAIEKVRSKSASTREIERVVPQHEALEQAAARTLSDLTPPSAIAGRWRAMLAYRRRLAGELLELLKVAKRQDAAGIRAIAASKLATHKSLLKTAIQAGFKSCGRVG
jgi:hypothetical protein